MKILSKFKDYYDFVAGRDTDPRKVYVRQLKIMATYAKDAPRLTSIRSCEWRKANIGFYLGEVWFCDVRYPYLNNLQTGVIYYDYFEIPEDWRMHLEGYKQTLRAEAINLSFHFDIVLKQEIIRKWKKNGWKGEFSKYWRFGKDKETMLNTKWNSPIIFTWIREGMHEELVINGPLEWVDFTKVKSPTATYQELYNWIPYNEPAMPSDPTDMSRFENKGFDKKTSFRGK